MGHDLWLHGCEQPGGDLSEARMSTHHTARFAKQKPTAQLPSVFFAALAAFLLAFPTIGIAADCSIEAHGAPAYESVKMKLKANYKNINFFQFARYEDIDVSVSSDCLFKLHGEFSFKKARNLKRKIFDAEVKPKQGAPNGMKVIKLRTSNE
jgi:hypothetical protein